MLNVSQAEPNGGSASVLPVPPSHSAWRCRSM